MTIAEVHSIGKLVLDQIGIEPQQLSGTTAVLGTGIDRASAPAAASPRFALSCAIGCQTGAATGAPDTQTAVFKVQDSAVLSSGDASWADYKPDGVNVASTTITAVSTLAQLDVDLGHARQYIRVVVTPAFTGGTTPKLFASAMVTLGGLSDTPSH